MKTALTLQTPLGIEKTTIDIHLEALSRFLNDHGITEIIINKSGIVMTENSNGWTTHKVPVINFKWCQDLAHLVQNHSNQEITEASPILGATLPGGQRIQIVIPPAVPPGTVSITIRRPGTAVLSLDDIIAGGAFDHVRCEQSVLLSGEERTRLEALLPERDRQLLAMFRARAWSNFLSACVLGRKNIVSSGATGAGKTTLSNALAAMIAPDERIITVEDVPEMRLPHANLVSLFYAKGGKGMSKLTPKDLLEACLRMRPDRVLLSELRGDETFFFIQNVLNSGHPGTITTLHATRAKLAFRRLVLLIKGSREGSNLSEPAILENLYALIDVVAQMARLPSGQRVVSEIYFDPAFAMKQMG